MIRTSPSIMPASHSCLNDAATAFQVSKGNYCQEGKASSQSFSWLICIPSPGTVIARFLSVRVLGGSLQLPLMRPSWGEDRENWNTCFLILIWFFSLLSLPLTPRFINLLEVGSEFPKEKKMPTSVLLLIYLTLNPCTFP